MVVLIYSPIGETPGGKSQILWGRVAILLGCIGLGVAWFTI